MDKIQIFKITGICNFEGEEEDAPCTNFPTLGMECLLDECQHFVLYDGEIEEDEFDDEEE